MKKTNSLPLYFFVLFLLFSPLSFAWNHSIELGYGYSHDPNHRKYNNSGVLLSGDIFCLWRTPATFWSITGSLGQWHSTSSNNKNLTTGAVSLALRYYPFNFLNQYPSYLFASFGPAILSHRQFDDNKQAKNITIQSNLGLGVEFHCIDVNLRLVHFSNAHTSTPNDGFNILYLLSIGYLF